VRLEPIVCPATETDEIGGTVDYGRVVDVVRSIVEASEFHLLERLASVIADALWDDGGLSFLEVAVTKPAPPVAIPVQAARVEVVRTA
jgi:dihydroneopterin aldolase